MWELWKGIVCNKRGDCVELGMRISIRQFLSLVVPIFLLSACRVVVETKINSDGSGDLHSSIVFSAEEKQNFTASPENAGKSICDSLWEGIPAGATFVEEEKDGETFCTTVRSFSNAGELRGYYENMGNITVNELKMGFGKLVFDVQADLTPKNGNEPAPMEWRLTVSGEIGNNNADSAEGNTLIWNIEPGEVANLHAESSVRIDPLIWVAIGLLLVLAIVLVLLLRRRAR